MARVAKGEGAGKLPKARKGKGRAAAEPAQVPAFESEGLAQASVAEGEQGSSIEGERLLSIGAEGLLPLGYLLRVMRDESETPARRMDAAKTAAPFLHPKLATMDVKSAGLDRRGAALLELIERARGEGGGGGGLRGR